MSHLKELLIEELRDILHAETQLTEALPKMADAAKHPKLKEAFKKHLVETRGQVERLHRAFELLGHPAQPKPCKGMAGIVKEGEETIEDGKGKDSVAADLALIAAAQKAEHYEIASYGTVRCLAKQIGELECAKLLSQTLGEEESADYLLTALADPMMQQALLNDMDGDVDLETVGADSGPKKKTAVRAAGARS